MSILLNILLTITCIYLYRLSKRDSSTQLLNKKQFEADITRLRRKNDVIIIIDIDKFKTINDTHGHAHGDKVIKEVSASIRRNIRRGDKAYRIGGDEFAIVTAYASVGDRIRTNLLNIVSVSIGVGKTYEEADNSMYINKRSV